MATSKEVATFELPTAPKLAELKTRQCTVEELQAALVLLIDLYNAAAMNRNAAIASKEDKQWRATI